MYDRIRGAALTVAAALSVALSVPAGAIEIQEVTSPGGIQAWLVEDHAIPIVSVAFAFRGGAAQDPEDKPGVANLMSGLLDEGASGLDSKAFQARLDELSIELSYNAGRDTFSGSMRTLSENIDDAELLLRLSVRYPRFDEEPVERIREQILTSIRRAANDPGSVAGDQLMATAFEGHPYGRPVSGTVETLSAVTRGDLLAYHRATFARDNLVVAVTGDITSERLAGFLDRVFGGLPQEPDLKEIAETEPATGQRIDIEMAVPQANIRLVGPGIKRDDPDFMQAYVSAYILGGGGFGSRLFEEVRENRGLAYGVGLGLGAYDRAGVVSAGTSTRGDQADEVIDILEDEIRRYAETGPTEDELQEAKDYLIGSYPLRFTTSRQIANQLLYIQLDDLGIDYVNERNGMIEALTLDDVSEAAARLFGGGAFTIVTVGQAGS